MSGQTWWDWMTPGGQTEDDINECSPPTAGDTKYLQLTKNGYFDPDIRQWDGEFDELNKSAFDYEPETVRSYHDTDSCHRGCTSQTRNEPTHLDDEDVKKFMSDVESQLEETNSLFQNNAGEMWIARLGAGRYNKATDDAVESSGAVKTAAGEVVSTNESYSKDVFKAMRDAVKTMRMEIAADHTSRWSPLRMTGIVLTLGIGSAFTDVSRKHFEEQTKKDIETAHDSFENAAKKQSESGTAYSAACEKLDAAVKEFILPAHPGAEKSSPPVEKKSEVIPKDTPDPEDIPDPRENTPYVPVTPGPGTTTTGDDVPKVDTPTDTGLEDKLNDLLNQTPSSANPFSDTMPSSGMPSSSGMPDMSSMVPQSSPVDPMSAMEDIPPVEDLKDEKPEDEVPEEEKPEDEKPEDRMGPEGEGEIDNPEGENLEEGDGTDGGDDAPEDGSAPVAAVATPDPNSEAARTVDVGGGRMVTFPSAQLAQMVKDMVEAGPDGNRSIYMAASEAGYDLPPMGQDIGQQVPPSLLREGDIIAAADGKNGVYLGNGDVLMEGTEIKRLEDVADFNGENQGIFRLAETESTGTGLEGPSQSVDAAPVTGGVTETALGSGDQTGTPGEPSNDAPVVSTDDTASGVNEGESDNTLGLDPTTVYDG